MVVRLVVVRLFCAYPLFDDVDQDVLEDWLRDLVGEVAWKISKLDLISRIRYDRDVRHQPYAHFIFEDP